MKLPSAIGLKKNSKGKPVNELQDFLQTFGYLKKSDNETTLGALEANFDDTTENALKKYQEFNDIPQSGELDETTIKQMRLPRCGCPDLNAGVENFAAQGNKWNKNNLTYKFVKFTSDLSKDDIRSAIAKAFSLWSEVTPLTFKEVKTGNADILISFVTGEHGDNNPFDGSGNVLAHAYFPPPNSGSLAGDAHFDDGETWSISSPASGIDLITVAAHEFGHSLGLSHSNVRGSLMFPSYSGILRSLHQDDISGIQSIYGSRV
ncbi:matrixin family metalloprotease [Bacillus thuringiensis]|nr:matrixin family metalloprotease [Bacillus thuringiensis]